MNLKQIFGLSNGIKLGRVGINRGGGTPFALTDLPLFMLVDPHAQLLGNDGDAVASITDQYGIVFVQTDNAKKPALKKGVNGINGQNTILFGGDDVLFCTGSVSISPNGSVFAVVRLTSTLANFQDVLSTSDTATANFFWDARIYHNATAPRPSVSQKNNDTTDRVDGDTVITSGDVYLMIWSSNGTAYAFRLNGADLSPVVVTGANTGDWWGDTPNRDVWAIGALKRDTDSIFVKGDIALLGASESVLSPTQIASLEAYCVARFAINFP